MSDRPAATNQPGKVIIGLTGNIATGKSAVMRLAAGREALTIDADKVVHELMDSDPEMQAAIAVAFGAEVRRPDGRIDRHSLGNIVFNDVNALRDLEAMTHPAVRMEVARRVVESPAAVVFIEAIKLLEGGLANACHQVWVTRCTKQRQLERLMVCRGMDAETAAQRIKAQPPQEEKVARADVVIDTDGLMQETEAQFTLAWDRLPDPATVTPKMTLTPGPAAMPAATTPARAKLEEATRSAPRPQEPAVAKKTKSRPENLQVRRARPSDIPSILLLIQKATEGAVKLKRAELLMALSERSYFIGQMGVDVSAVMGWSIDSQVARIDQIFIHPMAAAAETGAAILEEIEASANSHLCEIIVAFLTRDVSPEIRQIFEAEGYVAMAMETLPRVWQSALMESQPEDTDSFVIKVLRNDRLSK